MGFRVVVGEETHVASLWPLGLLALGLAFAVAVIIAGRRADPAPTWAKALSIVQLCFVALAALGVGALWLFAKVLRRGRTPAEIFVTLTGLEAAAAFLVALLVMIATIWRLATPPRRAPVLGVLAFASLSGWLGLAHAYAISLADGAPSLFHDAPKWAHRGQPLEITTELSGPYPDWHARSPIGVDTASEGHRQVTLSASSWLLEVRRTVELDVLEELAPRAFSLRVGNGWSYEVQTRQKNSLWLPTAEGRSVMEVAIAKERVRRGRREFEVTFSSGKDVASRWVSAAGGSLWVAPKEDAEPEMVALPAPGTDTAFDFPLFTARCTGVARAEGKKAIGGPCACEKLRSRSSVEGGMALFFGLTTLGLVAPGMDRDERLVLVSSRAGRADAPAAAVASSPADGPASCGSE